MSRRISHAPMFFPITCDTREQTPWIFGEDTLVTRSKLDAGDYAPTGYEALFTLERKAIGDLVACCSWERERFVRELERAPDYEFFAIIVEASLEDVARHNYRANVHPSAVVGSCVAFHVDYSVPTIWAGSATAAARIAERLMRRFVEKRIERDGSPS
jgi:DNA excision repair protein ERCC-4